MVHLMAGIHDSEATQEQSHLFDALPEVGGRRGRRSGGGGGLDFRCVASAAARTSAGGLRRPGS